MTYACGNMCNNPAYLPSLCALHRCSIMGRAMQRWMVYTYDRHMEVHVIHWRVRRLGSLVMQRWLQVSGGAVTVYDCTCLAKRQPAVWLAVWRECLMPDSLCTLSDTALLVTTQVSTRPLIQWY